MKQSFANSNSTNVYNAVIFSNLAGVLFIYHSGLASARVYLKVRAEKDKKLSKLARGALSRFLRHFFYIN